MWKRDFKDGEGQKKRALIPAEKYVGCGQETSAKTQIFSVTNFLV
jgi:hypothetical protein